MITETWLNSNTTDAPIISSLNTPPFNFVSFPRAAHAGGLGLVYHSNLNIIKTTIPNIDSSEIVFIHLKNSEQISLKIILIYRPPNNDIQTFISDFNNIIIPNITTNTIILGDFNIHINKNS